ncbi:hypothetical protein EQ500_11230 [Lactobacillus sp. XV13L]|nr:hypothetical protein [Lactobacillus sp. XV13L]
MKKLSIALASLGTMISIAATPALVGATTIDMPASAPNSGYVALDDNDHVIDSSSSIIKALAQKNENSHNTIQPRDVINWRYSRWVYYTDHHNFTNGYKWSHSNYYHSQEYHTSSAAVNGTDFTRRGANAHNYSIATAAGYGQAQAWYWAPYV